MISPIGSIFGLSIEMLRIPLLFILTFVFFFQAHAQLAGLNFSEVDRASYQEVLKLCRSDEGVAWAYSKSTLEYVEAIWNSTGGDLEDLKQLYKNRGISSYSTLLLQSKSLDQALTACFGEDQNRKNNFVLKLVLSDTLGSFMGVVGTLGLSGRMAFTLALRAVAPAAKLLVRALPALKILSHKKFVYSAIVAIAGVSTYEIYENYHHSSEGQRQLRAQELADLQALSQLQKEILSTQVKTESDLSDLQFKADIFLEICNSRLERKNLSPETRERILNLKLQVVQSLPAPTPN